MRHPPPPVFGRRQSPRRPRAALDNDVAACKLTPIARSALPVGCFLAWPLCHVLPCLLACHMRRMSGALFFSVVGPGPGARRRGMEGAGNKPGLPAGAAAGAAAWSPGRAGRNRGRDARDPVPGGPAHDAVRSRVRRSCAARRPEHAVGGTRGAPLPEGGGMRASAVDWKMRGTPPRTHALRHRGSDMTRRDAREPPSPARVTRAPWDAHRRTARPLLSESCLTPGTASPSGHTMACLPRTTVACLRRGRHTRTRPGRVVKAPGRADLGSMARTGHSMSGPASQVQISYPARPWPPTCLTEMPITGEKSSTV